MNRAGAHSVTTPDEEVGMRRAAVIMTLSGALLLLPHPVGAGGSWLDAERPYAAVGEVVLAWEEFSTGSHGEWMSHGPFHVYLVPAPRSFKVPGTIPRWAVPIGPMTIEPGETYQWLAAVEFTVPDLPAGRYSIQYCNDPCTVDGSGDLDGGSLYIGATLKEARLGYRLAILEKQRAILAKRVAGLQRELADAEEASTPTSQARIIPVPTGSVPEPPRPLVSGWAIAVAAAALLGSALLLRYRRRLPAVPDVVPPELVEEHREAEPIRD